MSLKYSNPLITAISNVFAEKRSTYGNSSSSPTIQDPITSASPEVQEIIERVLQVERDKLYKKNPQGINDDILKIIKDVIR